MRISKIVLAALLLLLQCILNEAQCVQQTITYERAVPVRLTAWKDSSTLTFPQFDPAMGVLDFIRITIVYQGNATYHYGYSGQDGRVPRSSTFTPQLSLTQLGLSYPSSGIDVGNYNLLSASFNQAFDSVVAYNRMVPSQCPVPSDPNTCDVNVVHSFGGTQLSDVSDQTTLSGFQGTGSVVMGGFAGGSATGSVMPGTGGAIQGTLIVGVDVTLQYYWTRIGLEKRVNGQLQRATPGLVLVAGAPVTFTYNVTNYGTATLSSIAILDDQLSTASIICPSVLPGCSSIICSGSSSAVQGQYTNNANCETFGKDNNRHLCPFDQSNYFGVNAQISLNKFTNGQRPSAGVVIQGGPITWLYQVTNVGNVILSNVAVTDDKVASVNIICPQNTLAVSESIYCSATGVAIVGDYTNVGSASGVYPPLSLTTSSTDPSSYSGNPAQISIRKYTNDVDTNAGQSEPLIAVGGAVTWKYTVTNNGGSILTAVVVNDNRVGSATCPLSVLNPGDVMTCSATGLASRDHYTNVGTASGVSPLSSSVGVDAATVRSTSPSSYFGVDQHISVVKFTNDVDIRTTSFVSPNVLLNDPVTWKFVVSNNGNVDLTNVAVVDNHAGSATCPSTSLVVGSSMVCSANGLATTTGAYTNVGTATGVFSPFGTTSTATSPSGYFGILQSISVVKFTNGVDIRANSQPLVVANSAVTWRFVVTNIGNSQLTSVTVTDNLVGAISCPSSTLAVSSSLTCLATGTAVIGQYNNVGTAAGVSPAASLANVGVVRATVMATSPSSYFGISGGIIINKLTNDVDIRTTAGVGPSILVGSQVVWKYVVTNPGNAQLTSITVTDDHGVAVTCPSNTLQALSSMVCSATGTAQGINYQNIGSAVGRNSVGGVVTATSPSSYVGFNPRISIVKFTNDVDIRSTSLVGPNILSGASVTWTYRVTNTGVGTLTSIVVTDDQSVPVTCPTTTLAATSSMVCSGTGLATAGSYNNVGSAFGLNNGLPASSTSPSNYFGVVQAISVVKFTNDVDIRSATRPLVLTGRAVTWKYAVTNTGNSVLTSVRVQDSKFAGFATCPGGTLGATSSMTCAATGVAISGDYSNTGTASGVSPLGTNTGLVTATSPSQYFGVTPVIDIAIFTNNISAAQQIDGPQLERNTPVTWKYVVTNTGNVDLTSVTVVDNRVGPITCDIPTPFDIGSSWSCFFTGTAGANPYSNTATAAGSAVGSVVTDVDISFYNPVTIPAVSIIKRTNGVWTRDSPIPAIRVDSTVTWTYEVTNSGEVALLSVDVTDDLVSSDRIICPKNELALKEAMVCSATGVAINCLYSNVGCATARGETGGAPVTDCSQSSYIGKTVAVSLVKFTNHFSHDAVAVSPGPCIETGEPVWWHYVVSNIGDDLLTGIVVTDDQLITPGAAPVCPETCLEPWHSMTCKAHGKAVSGPYHNIATATGYPANIGGGAVTAVDENFYRGVHASIRLSVRANGAHSNCPSEYDKDGEGCSVAVEEEGAGRSHGEGEGAEGDKSKSSSWGRQGPSRALLGLRGSTTSKSGEAEGHKYNGGKKGEHKRKCSKGEGCASVSSNERRKCHAPLFGIGANIAFTFVIENVGTEDLINVQLSFDGLDRNGAFPYVPFKPADVTCPTTSIAAHGVMTCTVPSFVNNQYGRKKLAAKVTAQGSCDGRCVQSRNALHWFTAEGEGEKQGGQNEEGEGSAEGRVFPTNPGLWVEQRAGQKGEGEGRSRW